LNEQTVEFGISILFLYFTHLLTKFNIFSRSKNHFTIQYHVGTLLKLL